MNDKDKLKKMKNMMYNHMPDEHHNINKCEIITRLEFVPHTSLQKRIESLDQAIASYKKYKMSDKRYWKKITEQKLIYQYGIDLKIDEIQFHLMWNDLFKEKLQKKNEYSAKPQKEGRDNKDVKVGSGSNGRNSIRYPSLKRKNAWKKFYKLFPHLNPNNKKDE